ncbi:hypothetical protein PTSG_04804 [Salpingoeca rosetta]|uniref:Uncharacterized protein n=1 Tax=Salpingoeca rosetta (strain ATCC 50818 / BSB-021) TaxID=946362 RepID=F2U9R3_SALR5|nr:uncharacterized protein PTSG_04804 [Salpingoeca rosetta]EGD73090.1 hypothetical protein PTSG_04804 [Salpingoeca rosetta]|eukprot:XP_004994121.1 hypothetical protein PTSG_04804 [Salpingoeca rosetta]
MMTTTARLVVVVVVLAGTCLCGTVVPVSGGDEECVADVRPFETTALPLWLKAHTTSSHNCTGDPCACRGEFGFNTKDQHTTLYGSADVAHLLQFVGQLSECTPQQIEDWATTIQGFQNTTGFYELTPGEFTTGFQPWHSTGYAASALALLGAAPRYRNQVYHEFANNTKEWLPTYEALLHAFPSAGCDSVHSCAHKMVAIPAVLALESGTKSEPVLDFLNWWFVWLTENMDPTTGTLCPPLQRDIHGPGVCLGAGAAVHFLLNFQQRYPWPYAEQLWPFARSLQQDNGFWSAPTSWLNLDGIFQMTRSPWDTPLNNTQGTRAACVKFATAAAALLNDKSTILSPPLINSTHFLPGLTGALGECERAFPGMLCSHRKWSCCAPFP